MQLVKGLKKEEPTIATMEEAIGSQETQLPYIEKLLKENKGVISDELPKHLPLGVR